MTPSLTPPVIKEIDEQVPGEQPIAVKSRKSLGFRVIEILILPIIAVLLLEGFFQFAGIGEQEFVEPDEVLGCRHIAGKPFTWRMEGYSKGKLSSVGLRDSEHNLAKPAGTVRIALLGDSSTEGMQVPLNDTYGKVLERLLNEKNQRFEVINFGCSGYSTGQQLIQYERYVRQYHPDIVMLLYNRGDSMENIYTPGNDYPRPHFYLDQNNQLQADTWVVETNKSKLKPNPFWDYLRRNSRIYGVITGTGLILSIDDRCYHNLQHFWTKRTKWMFKDDSAKTPHVDYPKQNPDTVTEALISRLNAEVKRDGGEFVFAIFPNVVQDPDLQRQQGLFEILSNKQNFAFIDLTAPFFNADFKSYFLQYHFSSKGHAYVAQTLRPLIENLLSRKATQVTPPVKTNPTSAAGRLKRT